MWKLGVLSSWHGLCFVLMRRSTFIRSHKKLDPSFSYFKLNHNINHIVMFISLDIDYMTYILYTVINTAYDYTFIFSVIYLLLYHPIIFIFSWAYWKTIFTETGAVPKEVSPSWGQVNVQCSCKLHLLSLNL